MCRLGWLVVFINVDLAIFQPYLDLEAGDNQSLKIQVARRGIEPRSSCSASQELNHSATAAPTCAGRKISVLCADATRPLIRVLRYILHGSSYLKDGPLVPSVQMT